MDDLRERHVVITGGTGALGVAVVEHLLERGAICHVPCVEDAVPERFALARHERVRATAKVRLDDEAATAAYYGALPPLWGSIHLAGGFAMAPVVDTSLADLLAMFQLNAVTSFLCCREAVRAMRRSGGGRIVNVAARPAAQPAGGMIAYTTSKAAVASLTQCLAKEVEADGILINAILPSIMDTEANRRAMPRADFATWPKPAEVAVAIGFLVAPGNALTSGTLLPVYGKA